MEQNLRKEYNDIIKKGDAFAGDPRKSIMRRVRQGKIPAIQSTDTGIAGDVTGFILKSPDNTFNAFYNPRKVNVDDVGRLSEKAFRKFYSPALSLVRWTAWLRPNLREDGIKNLRAMDLDSFSYMEPILHYSDSLTLQHVEPLFFGSEAYHGDEHADDETHHSPCHKVLVASSNLKQFAAKIKTGSLSAADQDTYNAILKMLYDQQEAIRMRMTDMQGKLEDALAEIDKIKVDTKNNALKRARVKAMRQHFARLQKQGLQLFKHTEAARHKLHALGNGADVPADQFAEKLETIGSELEHKLTATRCSAEDLADMAHARLTRKVRLKNEDGKYASDKNAAAEDYRRLKLGIDMLFVPDTPQTLGVIKPQDKDHNAESFFCKLVEHGLTGAFDDEGNHIPVSKRGAHYGKDLAEFVAKLYALNKPEDALYGVKLLKMAEGKENYQMFQPGFNDLVKQYLATYYGISGDAVENNPHAKLFLDRVRDIATADDHSPLIFGPRDTAKQYYKRVRNYIYGRMYPSSDSFVAIPLHMEMIQKPLFRARGGLFAYLTGGELDDIKNANRPAKEGSILEQECELYIKRTWWWRKLTEEEEKAELDKDGNKKKRFILTRLRRGYKRAPFWAKTPVRLAQLAGIGASAVLLTGGLASLPMLATLPIYALGAIGAINYTSKAARNTWKLPLVNKPIKFAAKWALIAGVTAGAAYLAWPFLPAVGAWAMGVAIAHPIAAGIIAAPFLALPTIKIGTMAARLIKGKSADANKKVTFETLRELEGSNESDIIMLSEDDDFLPSDTPEPDDIIVLDLDAPMGTQGTSTGDDDDDTQNPHMDRTIHDFMARMEARDEAFMERMEEIFNARRSQSNATPEQDADGNNAPPQT